ncbi:MAG: hypothetical protein ORN54_15575 [Cyclobacteriaceae bacterium]|nr:hypothetical protein [Cyclobacteriaceae bacterium]
MIKSLFAFFLFFSSQLVVAQSSDSETSIRESIDRLFLGISRGDTAMVRSSFATQVTLATISKGKTGQPSIQYQNGIADFLKAIGTPHPESWNESIWDVKINVDSDFAQAWASYAFYIGKRSSHCGVDAFHLVRGVDDQWKIFHLADTRQKEDCNIPENIKNRFK